MSYYEKIHQEVGPELLERFLRYVKIDTQSDESLAHKKTPTTEGQWELLKLLVEELKAIGVTDISLDEQGYLIASVPGYSAEGEMTETIAWMAHVDTSSDAPSKNVRPLLHKPYDGKDIFLQDGVIISTAESPLLKRYKGETVISSDGTTLLGADDKSGIAEIMTALHWLLRHPKQERPNLEIIFTPDEETGVGMKHFPVEKLSSRYCFTLDGGEEGELETECYEAYKALVVFQGKVIHPGKARGRLVNAISMASSFISMIPRSESPEATDGRYGNYWAHRIEGNLERAELSVFYRSFDLEDIQRRSDALKTWGKAVEAIFPGGKCSLEISQQYQNMRREIDKHPHLVEILRKAYRGTGIEPIEDPIRGGTDGSQLTAMGIPTPNIFAGGANFHSRSEWIALPAMSRAVGVLVNLAKIWANGDYTL